MHADAARGPNVGRRGLVAGGAALAAAPATARAGRAHADGPWPMLAKAIFKAAPIHDGSGLLAIEAPYRAADAALVPIGLRFTPPANDGRRVERITLVIDQNPSPVAATFSLGGNSGIDRIATHVRVDDYTYLHAVAALSDGALYGVRRYVKAAGGCSAPAVRDEAGGIPLGTMRFREFAQQPGAPAGVREAQLMIRHPNHSGMQMDQITRYYIPAHFITQVRIWQGAELLLSIESGISIAQNPSFRFRFRPPSDTPPGDATWRAEATDNKGGRFTGHWPAAAA